MKKFTKLLITGLMGLMLLTVGCSSSGSSDNVTMSKFNQIKNGMTYEQVSKILGPGQLSSETKQGNLSFNSYSWQNSDGSNIQIMFQNNKVDTKAQAGLK